MKAEINFGEMLVNKKIQIINANLQSGNKHNYKPHRSMDITRIGMLPVNYEDVSQQIVYTFKSSSQKQFYLLFPLNRHLPY